MLLDKVTQKLQADIAQIFEKLLSKLVTNLVYG